MILYHGSNVDIQNISLSACRPYKDFGRGFYLTDIPEQAERMAERVARQYVMTSILQQRGFTCILKMLSQCNRSYRIQKEVTK